MGNKGDLSDFKRRMVVGVRLAGLIFEKLLIYWDHAQPSLRFRENGPKMLKYPVGGSCVDENAFLMSEVRGEWADWLEMKEKQDDRKETVTQITTRYNQGMQNTISKHTTRRTLKQMGYSSRRPHRVPLLSDKNRTRRLQFTQAHHDWTIEDWKKRCLVWWVSIFAVTFRW